LSHTLPGGRDEGLGVEKSSQPDGTRPEGQCTGVCNGLGDTLQLLDPQAEVVDPLDDGRVRWDLVQNPRLKKVQFVKLFKIYMQSHVLYLQ
jgi:hypothetical protein